MSLRPEPVRQIVGVHQLENDARVIIQNNTIITVHPRLRIKRRRYGRREREE